MNYRESYGMFVSCGILFNHEGERCGLEFVTRKVTNAVGRICLGKETHIDLGDLWPKRDWGYADDYVRGMGQIMRHSEPDILLGDLTKAETGLGWERQVDFRRLVILMVAYDLELQRMSVN